MSRARTAVVALGGNALLPPGERGTQKEQTRRARAAARRIAEVAGRGFRVVVVHGNGPQVGNLLIQMEEGASHVPPYSLDLCVAATQGTIGFLLEEGLRNELLARRIRRPVATILTLAVVDARDPAFRHPEKPVGPLLTAQRVRYLRMVEHAAVVEEAGRGHRKVVPSPEPRGIIPAEVLRALVHSGAVVIAGGGGGIPVVRDPGGTLRGVEAVVDKDRTAALVAEAVEATHLFILTEVPCVYERFGTSRQRPLRRVRAAEMEARLAAGEFPAGSMGPKIESALDFLARGGREVVITSIAALPRALSGATGTRIVR